MAGQRNTVEQIAENEWRITTTYNDGREVVRTITDKIDIWNIGNTGMRNPWRIPGGFKVYVESNQVGRLRAPEDQQAFKRLLMERGEIGGDPERDESASITRKYRLMFNKYGFAYPEVTRRDGFAQEELGSIDDITPAGRRFYEANTVEAQQECFLRGLIVPMEPLDEEAVFSPLLWVLQVMFKLQEVAGDYKINFIEFATCVQTTNPSYDLGEVAARILQIRSDRERAENKKRFDNELIHSIWELHYDKQEGNFKEYADMNIRYLLSSGIIKRAGRGITLVQESRTMASVISEDATSTAPLLDRWKTLCEGAPLPTDNTDTALQVLQDLIDELEQNHIEYTIPDVPLDSPENINIVRHSLRQDIDRFKEERYADAQRHDWEEIYEYMQLLIVNNGREKDLGDDHIIKVPRSEAAAYLEWVLWRSFLAIDHTINKPYEARGFRIDQDYLPVGTAPGGGADMVFEFDDYVIVVEVTMSTGSRQEAMEGEPVRRHVADYAMIYDRPVYGIFIANNINSNTAETFRIGVWYNQNDERMVLRIVPFTLSQFAGYFRHMFLSNEAHPQRLLDVFNICFDAKDGCEAPAWKSRIEEIMNRASVLA